MTSSHPKFESGDLVLTSDGIKCRVLSQEGEDVRVEDTETPWTTSSYPAGSLSLLADKHDYGPGSKTHTGYRITRLRWERAFSGDRWVAYVEDGTGYDFREQSERVRGVIRCKGEMTITPCTDYTDRVFTVPGDPSVLQVVVGPKNDTDRHLVTFHKHNPEFHYTVSMFPYHIRDAIKRGEWVETHLREKQSDSKALDLDKKIDELKKQVAELQRQLRIVQGGALWKTAQGDVVSIRQMSDSHLANILEGNFGSKDFRRYVRVEQARREVDEKFKQMETPPSRPTFLRKGMKLISDLTGMEREITLIWNRKRDGEDCVRLTRKGGYSTTNQGPVHMVMALADAENMFRVKKARKIGKPGGMGGRSLIDQLQAGGHVERAANAMGMPPSQIIRDLQSMLDERGCSALERMKRSQRRIQDQTGRTPRSARISREMAAELGLPSDVSRATIDGIEVRVR